MIKADVVEELTRWVITAAFRIDILTSQHDHRAVADDYMSIDPDSLKEEVIWYFRRLKPKDFHILTHTYLPGLKLREFYSVNGIKPSDALMLRNEALRYVQSLVR